MSSELCNEDMHETLRHHVFREIKNFVSLQGGNELKIKAVFEQIWDNLSSEHCTAVMHQTTKQQVVYEITT